MHRGRHLKKKLTQQYQRGKDQLNSGICWLKRNISGTFWLLSVEGLPCHVSVCRDWAEEHFHHCGWQCQELRVFSGLLGKFRVQRHQDEDWRQYQRGDHVFCSCHWTLHHIGNAERRRPTSPAGNMRILLRGNLNRVLYTAVCDKYSCF